MVDFFGDALVTSGAVVSTKENVPVLKFRSGMIFVDAILEFLRRHKVPILPTAAMLKNF